MRTTAQIPAFGVSPYGEGLAQCCNQNFSLTARFGVTDFAAQSLVRQDLNILRGLFIYVCLAAIFAHARRYVSDEQDGIAAFNRQHRSTFLKAIMFAD